MKKTSRTAIFGGAVGLFSMVLAGCGLFSTAMDRVKSIAGGPDGSVSGISGEMEPGIAGEIVFLEGLVTVEGKPANIGDAIHDGDTIVVDNDAYAEISFGDHRILRAQSDTQLVLDASSRRFVLERGALGVLQSKARVLSPKNDWILETPTVVAAVRGTVYFAKVENPDEVYFCLCNGKIHLEDTGEGGVLNLEAAHHQAVRFLRSENGVVYENAPMQYHSDAEMESLADRVNVPIDWTRIPD